LRELLWILSSLAINDVLDIFIVALLFFAISFLFRGTQAVTLFRGMMIIITGLILMAALFQLQALGWLLTNSLVLLALAIPVIFQPEIRRALEQVGRGSLGFSRAAPDDSRLKIVDETCRAAEKLSERRHGALIVLQRQSRLDEFVRTGVRLNSDYSAELLLTIFWPKTELHDGAVIVDGQGSIASAAAVLPLTASRNLPHPKMGTRHRAALGISEVSDAICVVVSEETGKIAITSGGRMVSRLDIDRLRTILTAFYGPKTSTSESLLARLMRWLRQPYQAAQPQPEQQ
jgi:diadenylate cyclase